MFTEKQLYDNSVLLLNRFKKLVAEVTNAIPDELRICNKIDARGVLISNGEITLATGKRINPYSVKKFYDAFESTLDSFNREVIEELVMCLQNDAMRYPSILNGIYHGKCSELLLEKMWYRYQMLYRATKYKAIKVETTCLIPRTEFYHMPFVFDLEECYYHEFFNFNYWQYVDVLAFICRDGSIRQCFEEWCVARRNEAAKMNERRQKQMNVVASKPNGHLMQGCVKAPTTQRKNG